MMGYTSLLFECFIELLNILHFPKHKIQLYDTNILEDHQEKTVPYYNYGLYVYEINMKHKT